MKCVFQSLHILYGRDLMRGIRSVYRLPMTGNMSIDIICYLDAN